MVDERPRERAELLASLPPEPDVSELWAEIRRKVSRSRRRMVVLDDDPTGVQTVHDIDVLTTWQVDDLSHALRDSRPLFYVLTNSRALDRAAAVNLAREIVDNLAIAGAGIEVDVVSRGDSTLRGHYPWELEPLLRLFGQRGPGGHLIVPAFPEGGRITVDGIHYLEEDGVFVPVAQTDFARDPSFGFTSSYLPDWVQEKSGGRRRAADVLCVPLHLLRSGDADRVASLLLGAQQNRPIAVDAVSYADLVVLVAGLLRAEDRGARYLARTAAAFVKVRGGIPDRAPLSADVMLGVAGGAGLVLVGSYVKRTGEQLARALELPFVSARELEVLPLLRGESQNVVRELAAWVDDELLRARVPLVYTSRELFSDYDNRRHVEVAAHISAALSSIPAQMRRSPRWVLTKGGITSSDVATQGLRVRRARVLGQLSAGIPVWRLGAESRFPGIAYVVFPGNVGGPDALADAITTLAGEGR